MNQTQRIIVSIGLVIVAIGFWGTYGSGGHFFGEFQSRKFGANLVQLGLATAIPLFFIWKTKEADE